MDTDLEATASEPDRASDSELVERQRRRIVELEELAAELPELRRRLLEAEQLLAELPELRRRTERLDEIESSPALRLLNRARERAKLRADSSVRSIRVQAKRALAGLARRIAGD
jgi:hypothetical protein